MKPLLRIAYLGTAYHGYQVQANGVTVQQKLNEAAADLFGFDCDVTGCSRTDSGVHARDFAVTIAEKGKNGLASAIGADKLPQALNVRLPDDIVVLSACFVPDSFHARYDVQSKRYEYLIWNGRERNPFLTDRAWHLPAPFDEAAIAEMRRGAAAFVGRHDFSALRDSGADTDDKDAVREVFEVSLEKNGDLIAFRVRADGFLYHMVRIMTGTLVDVGRGRLAADDLPRLLASGDRRRMGATAPAAGLYLDKVFY